MFARSKVFLWACSSLLAVQGLAQTSPTPYRQSNSAGITAAQLVDRLVENAEVYRTTLPSLTAHESIVSKFDEVVVFGKHIYKAEATVRMVRKSPGDPLEESREITAMDGKPLPLKPGHARLPVDLADDFSATSTLPSDFFSAQHRGCFNFVLDPHPEPDKPLELLINPASAAASLPSCEKAREGITGIARMDPATLQLTHLEATIPEAAAAARNRISFISADYAPAKLGDKTFWLPTSLTARWTVGKTPYAWASRYSDYHQYTATATILPGTSD